MNSRDIILDTNVIVAALRSRHGASNRLLKLVGTDAVAIHISVPLVLEYESVGRRLIGEGLITEAGIEAAIDYLCQVGQARRVYYLWRPFLSDPKDDMILELAVAAGCQTVVTFNRRDFAAASSFGIQAITPGELLRQLGVEIMSQVAVTLPESLHERAQQAADRESIPLEQLMTVALTEKLSALQAQEYIQSRAARGNREKFLQVLNDAPDIEPSPEDLAGG